MKNSADWMKEIEDLYEGQKTGRIKAVQAVEMNNSIGKMIALIKLQLEYNNLRHRLGANCVKIAVLESSGGIATALKPPATLKKSAVA